MGRRKDQDATTSRERILEVAAAQFSHKGYAGAGVDQLAALSGIAKTAIYYHFGNKEGLLAAVLDRAASAWIEGIRAAAQQAGTPFERLDRTLIGVRTLLDEKPWIMKLLQILALEVADDKPDVRATLQAIIRRARAALVEGIRDALGADLPGADVVASVFLALLDGIALGRQIIPEELALDEIFAEIRRLMVFMIASRLDPAAVAQAIPAPAVSTPVAKPKRTASRHS
jgi:AcrR family transcriptional regulator